MHYKFRETTELHRRFEFIYIAVFHVLLIGGGITIWSLRARKGGNGLFTFSSWSFPNPKQPRERKLLSVEKILLSMPKCSRLKQKLRISRAAVLSMSMKHASGSGFYVLLLRDDFTRMNGSFFEEGKRTIERVASRCFWWWFIQQKSPFVLATTTYSDATSFYWTPTLTLKFTSERTTLECFSFSSKPFTEASNPLSFCDDEKIY